MQESRRVDKVALIIYYFVASLFFFLSHLTLFFLFEGLGGG